MLDHETLNQEVLELKGVDKMADNLIKKLYEETGDMEEMQEKIEQLEDAREHLREAHNVIQDAISGISSEANIKAYFLDKLKIMISEDHGFMTNDPTIDSIIKKVEEEYDESEESKNESKEEKLKFEPGEKVKNSVGETLTIVGKDGDNVTVEEQPNKVYKPSELVKYVDKEEVVKDENKSE